MEAMKKVSASTTWLSNQELELALIEMSWRCVGISIFTQAYIQLDEWESFKDKFYEQ